MICIIGFMLLGNITKNMQGDINTASKVFYSGLSMGWINIIVQTVIPDTTAIGVGYVEIVSTLALACMLQVRIIFLVHCSGSTNSRLLMKLLCRVYKA
jgi:hypothetical protein